MGGWLYRVTCEFSPASRVAIKCGLTFYTSFYCSSRSWCLVGKWKQACGWLLQPQGWETTPFSTSRTEVICWARGFTCKIPLPNEGESADWRWVVLCSDNWIPVTVTDVQDVVLFIIGLATQRKSERESRFAKCNCAERKWKCHWPKHLQYNGRVLGRDSYLVYSDCVFFFCFATVNEWWSSSSATTLHMQTAAYADDNDDDHNASRNIIMCVSVCYF